MREMHASPHGAGDVAWRERGGSYPHAARSTHSTHGRRCVEQGQSEQAVGVALESRRLDKLEYVIKQSTDTTKTLKYALRVSQKLVINRDFRQQVRSRS